MLDENAMPIPKNPAEPDWQYDGVCGTITFPNGKTVHLQGDDAAKLDHSVEAGLGFGASMQLILGQFEDIAT